MSRTKQSNPSVPSPQRRSVHGVLVVFTAVAMLSGCAGDRDRSKRGPMGAAAARGADLVIVTDDNPRSEAPERIRAAVLAGAREVAAERVHEVPDRAEAIARAIRLAGPAGTVLVAGKGHEDYQDIGGRRRPFSDIELVQQVLRGEQA